MQAEMVDSYPSGSSAISLSIQTWGSGLELCSKGDTANLCTKILDFRGFDSSRILIQRGGIPGPVGNFLESLSQRILVEIILVGRLGEDSTPGSHSKNSLSKICSKGCFLDR